MSVYLKLLSGDILTFSIFSGYNFSNLRSDFYNMMSEQLEIRDLDCILIFEDSIDEYNKVSLIDLVIEGKMYNVFINKVCVRIIYDEFYNSIKFDHDFRLFPGKFILQITKSIQDNYYNSYLRMHGELVDFFEEDVNFFNDNSEDQDNPYQNFIEYSDNKYGKDNLTLEDIITEYINTFISKRTTIEEFIYL